MIRLHDYPEEGELVVCSVRIVKNFGAFVTLDEYGDKEGFIHIAEVTTGWVKYIRDYVREGQKIVCKVLRVNPHKGHIDLSLRLVNEHQRREKIQEWKNEQKAEKLFEIVATKINKDVEICYKEFGVDLMDKFGSMYMVFEQCAINPNVLNENSYSGEWVEHFTQIATENIVPPFVNIKGYLELTCPLSDGVNHIKNSLLEIEKENDVIIKVQYVGAPKYRILVQAPNYKIAEEEMKNAVEKAIKSIEGCNGTGSFSRKE
ncbi:MAG: translation initiation factor IF-2 subunit alpha [Thermoplasmata archaeon]|nr:MAG: translation initiation factor IF-2 subunit alpha [Thermoplasmata archaeon]